jgi:predicted permease
MRTIVSRIVGFLRGSRLDRDLDDEVRFHLAMAIDEHVRNGLSPRDARREALRSFGGVVQMKEEYRDQRSLPWLETFLKDARYGVRALTRAPGFTLAALVTLALGIGANTAIFSVVHAVLLRPLPFPSPDRLVHLVRRYPTGIGSNHDGARYLFFRDRLQSVEALSAHSGAGSFNLSHGDRAEFVTALGVSKEYFRVFGVYPAIGQAFAAEHDVAGGPLVAILGDGLWRRQFGADPAVIGRSIVLGDKAHTVVGVMPAGYRPEGDADLLLPLRPGLLGRGGGFNYMVSGRLRDGVSVEKASAEAATIWKAFEAQHPEKLMRGELPTGFMPLQASLASDVRPGLVMMLGAVALLLLIACANTANLLLVRASGRGREIAVRAALGAGRGRILAQLLTESLILAIAGAAVGVVLAYWSVPALLSLTPPEFVLSQDVRLDATVLAVTLAVAVLTGLVFGLVPAVSLSRGNLADAFKADGGRTTAGRRTGALRTALVVGEVGLCTLLLVAAALLIQTFVRLRAVDPGFDPRGVLAARMSMQGDRYADPSAVNRFYQEGLDRIRRLPGVRAAAVASGIPIARALNLNVDVLDGPEKIERALIDWRYVTPGYFETMRIPVVSGRGFTDADRAGAPPVAVVSEEFARRFFKGTAALGRHIRVFAADGSLEIVGIVADLKEGGLKFRALPVMYVPIAQTHAEAIRTTHSYFQVNWVVRADDAGADLGRRIEEEIRQVDPRQPFSSFTTMDEVKRRAMATEAFQMTLLSVFAGVGLALAAAGIYGLVAFSVAQRTREFGIRVALGAAGSRILLSVVGRGLIPAVGGVILGGAAAAALTRLLRRFVWGVSTQDPVTFGVVGLVLLAVAVVATLVPAVRAVRLDPVRALRE